MASPNGQGDHDGLIYYLQRTRELTFSEVKNTTLPKELCAAHDYKIGWQSAECLYSSKRSSYPLHNWGVMETECFVAVMCYTLVNPKIGRSLNRYCREARPTAESWDAFPYKSLFFFLIKAFEKLPPFEAGTLYRGVNALEVKDENRVPFVQFVSASVSSVIASRFGKTQLKLTGVPSSVVRNISPYSAIHHHKEVLIWPFCTFDVYYSADDDDGGAYVGYVAYDSDDSDDFDFSGFFGLGRVRKTLRFRSAKPSVGEPHLSVQ